MSLNDVNPADIAINKGSYKGSNTVACLFDIAKERKKSKKKWRIISLLYATFVGNFATSFVQTKYT